MAEAHTPRVAILFCTKCKWNLRASWYLQELLQTFGAQLGEVALVPSDSGVFKVIVETVDDTTADTKSVEVWDRVTDGGFPDSKVLKQRVRDVLFPQAELGHVDGANKNGGLLVDCVECQDP